MPARSPLAGGIIANSSVVTVNGGATFDISNNGGFVAISTLAGSGTVQLGGNGLAIFNGSTEFSGAINGSGGLEIEAGTQTLSGVNGYTNATQIDTGATLALKGNGSIASSAFVGFAPLFAGAATLDISPDHFQAPSVGALFDIGGVGVISLGSKTLTITPTAGPSTASSPMAASPAAPAAGSWSRATSSIWAASIPTPARPRSRARAAPPCQPRQHRGVERREPGRRGRHLRHLGQRHRPDHQGSVRRRRLYGGSGQLCADRGLGEFDDLRRGDRRRRPLRRHRRLADQDRRRHADADGRQHLHRRHDDQWRPHLHRRHHPQCRRVDGERQPGERRHGEWRATCRSAAPWTAASP